MIFLLALVIFVLLDKLPAGTDQATGFMVLGAVELIVELAILANKVL